MIFNKTRRRIAAKTHSVCSSVLSKAKGLMFSTRKDIEDNALIFPFSKRQRVGLHMFFVFYPIDVLFLDAHKRVVEEKRRFLPFTAYNSKNSCNYVLELEAGAIERSKTKIGDVFEW